MPNHLKDEPYPPWICGGCGKVVRHDTQIFGSCQDCGGEWRRATKEDLECDVCGDLDSHGIFGSTERLCTRHLAERQYEEAQNHA